VYIDDDKCGYCDCHNCEDVTCRDAICSVCYNDEDGVCDCEHRIVALDGEEEWAM
jgi:hypothetical protein